MYESTQLQFKLLGSEAQIATLRRLALCGASIEDMAMQTGLSAEEIQSRLSVDKTEPPTESTVRHWRLRRSRVSQALARSAIHR
jgi:hypothetical protein